MLSTRIIVYLVLFCGLWAPQLEGAPFDWEFEIAGNPDIFGPPGSTIGWGYKLTNLDPDNWLALTAVDADLFQHAFPLAIFDLPIVPPGEMISAAYDPFLFQGLYELTWALDAPAGFVNSGMFTLTGDWYDGDPLGGGNLLLAGSTRSTSYSATVSLIPEPAPAGLVFFGLVAAAAAGGAARHSNTRTASAKGRRDEPCNG